LAAEAVFDKCRLVAAFLHIPRVDAKRVEIADLALGAADCGNEILWLIAGGIADGILKFLSDTPRSKIFGQELLVPAFPLRPARPSQSP